MRFVRENVSALDLRRDEAEMAAYKAAQGEVVRQERRLANLRTALLDGTFTGEEYAAEKAKIDIRLADARATVETHRKMAGKREEALDALCGVVAGAGAVFDRLTPSQCKEFVRVVFGRVAVSDGKRIEPPQDSVFQILVTAQAAKAESGEGEGT